MTKMKATKGKKKRPQGLLRFNFLKDASRVINESSIKTSLAHKLNIYYNNVAFMTQEKYIIKIPQVQKTTFCKRCKAVFSEKRKNVKIQTVEREKNNLNITICQLCGYKKPKVVRNRTLPTKKKRKKVRKDKKSKLLPKS